MLSSSVALAGTAVAAASAVTEQGRTDTDPRVLDGQPMPEPPPEQSAGPVKPGRGSSLSGKVAVVTGAARGIGRAIAVEFAANGADVIAIDRRPCQSRLQRKTRHSRRVGRDRPTDQSLRPAHRIHSG
jgi:hypothetical protein